MAVEVDLVVKVEASVAKKEAVKVGTMEEEEMVVAIKEVALVVAVVRVAS